MTLTEFLLARIAEETPLPSENHSGDCAAVRGFNESMRRLAITGIHEPVPCDCRAHARVLAECEAKRRIVEWHKNWPVLVTQPPSFDPLPALDDLSGVSFRMSQQIAWLTEQEYRERFGSEPPTGPVLRLLALPYADHPDYDVEWRPDTPLVDA